MAGQMFGIEVRIFMVRVSYDQKPFRRSMMETWGGEVLASPSSETRSGRRIWIASLNRRLPRYRYFPKRSKRRLLAATPTMRSDRFLNHVLLHQTVIGLEAKKQFEKIATYLT